MLENLEQLIKTIRERQGSSPDKSYTKKLLNDKNLNVAKVKEEIAELIESVEQNSNKILQLQSYSVRNQTPHQSCIMGLLLEWHCVQMNRLTNAQVQ